MLPKGNKKAVKIPNGAVLIEVAAMLEDDRMWSWDAKLWVGGWPGIWKDPLILEIISRLNGKCEWGLSESSFTWIMYKERWSGE